MLNSYYILENGAEKGPFTHHELMDRGIRVDTLVLSPIGQEWQDAAYLPEFQEHFKAQGIYNPSYSTLATFWWRLLAFIIDYFAISVGIGLLYGAYALISGLLGTSVDVDSEESDNVLGLVILLVYFLYNALFEATELQGSIGKLVCKLIVVDIEGKRISFGKALARNFGKIISNFLCAAGFIMILFNSTRQGWHDQIARTYVIRKSN